ncbi:MAG: MFS transporter [Candidatus Limnocylindria bacterium]
MLDAAGRPTERLPARELVRLSVYWLGLSSIFAGLTTILAGRLEYDALVEPGAEGRTLFLLTIGGALIAMLIQPTVGSISDYTTSRWGRRKPYIFIGTVLDLVFLLGIALSQDLLAIAAFVALLQFSSNVAQGPFQGYVPDLVPAPQVGVASALVGLMQILGNVAGFVIAGIAVAADQFALGLIALGVLEFATMISVVVRVREGRRPTPRAGRSWASIAAEAWGTDVLRERSFLFLVGSRLAILMAGGVLTNLAIFYLSRSLGLDQEGAGGAFTLMVGLVAAGTLVTVIPSARLSDRVGRKRVIYLSCLIGAGGMAIVALAPSFEVAVAGAVLYGLSAGTFLAVDWALMTDIIPKAASGRYMGLSNVATASAGVLAIAIGGSLMDVVGGPAGPRAALWLAVALFAVGAVLLWPVDERRREDALAPAIA